MSNIILRPVYNRPEMLFLSIEYEIKAREYFKSSKKYFTDDDYTTIFIVEHGSHPAVMDFVKRYPYSSAYVERPEKYGLTVNILEGFKAAFERADNHVVYIEDDILIHKTYFEYMDKLLSHPDVGKYSVISPYNKNNDGNVNKVYKGHHYAALAPLIGKDFYETYIRPNSVMEYYKNPPKYVIDLNEKYREYWGKGGYKYKDATHYMQAGLLNRLVDIAMIEEESYVIMPEVNRQIHIGYYGANRPGGTIPGKNFAERLTNLREIIKSGDEMYKHSATKQYNDYLAFSSKLDTWNGTLEII